MSNLNQTPLPPDLRDQIISELEKYIRSEIRLEDACINSRYITKLKWCKEMLRELEEYEPQDLPYAPKDSPFHPQWAEAATKRVILFLQNDRIYHDGYGPVSRMLGYLVGYTLLIGFVLFLGLGLIDEFVYQAPWIDRLQEVVAISVVGALGVLLLLHAVGLTQAGIHIFRVRVLRQDLRPIAESDIWPYLNLEDYEHDLKTTPSLPPPRSAP